MDKKCKGTNCPIKEKCKRFISTEKLEYLIYTPYDHRLNKCESFIKQ